MFDICAGPPDTIEEPFLLGMLASFGRSVAYVAVKRVNGNDIDLLDRSHEMAGEKAHSASA